MFYNHGEGPCYWLKALTYTFTLKTLCLTVLTHGKYYVNLSHRRKDHRGWVSIMIIVLASQFHIYLLWINTHLALCLNRFLNVKALVGTFKKENVLVWAFSVIVKLQPSRRFVDGSTAQPQHTSTRKQYRTNTTTTPPRAALWL